MLLTKLQSAEPLFPGSDRIPETPPENWPRVVSAWARAEAEMARAVPGAYAFSLSAHAVIWGMLLPASHRNATFLKVKKFLLSLLNFLLS